MTVTSRVAASVGALALVEKNATADAGLTVEAPDGGGGWVSWAEVHDDARRLAGWLVESGVSVGSRVAVVGVTSRELVTAIQAVWLAGAAVTILPPVGRLGPTRFAAETARRCRAADVSLLLADATVDTMIDGVTVAFTPAVLEAARARRTDVELPPVAPESAALLQFTSGSTDDPRAVVLSHANLAHNGSALWARWSMSRDDCWLSWLPLYHDMGLIGAVVTMMSHGAPLVLADTSLFAASPRTWLRLAAQHRATVTGAPNSAFGLAARTLCSEPELDLTALRVAFNGSEPVRPRTVARFLDAARKHGFEPSALIGVYGLAEATLAVSIPAANSGVSFDAVDARALEEDRRAVWSAEPGAREFALLGPPIADTAVRAVDERTGEIVPDRRVGELEVAGPSVAQAFLHGARVAGGGWLRTGDLGYIVDGQVVVCGRRKDVVFSGGRTIAAETIEASLDGMPGVRQGRVAACGVLGPERESIIVVAERADGDDDAVRRSIVAEVRNAFGLALSDVLLVPPGALPKTTSGKLQRGLVRRLYERGAFGGAPPEREPFLRAE